MANPLNAVLEQYGYTGRRGTPTGNIERTEYTKPGINGSITVGKINGSKVEYFWQSNGPVLPAYAGVRTPLSVASLKRRLITHLKKMDKRGGKQNPAKPPITRQWKSAKVRVNAAGQVQVALSAAPRKRKAAKATKRRTVRRTTVRKTARRNPADRTKPALTYYVFNQRVGRDGYSKDGSYFGTGAPVFHYQLEGGNLEAGQFSKLREDDIRADSLTDAKATVKSMLASKGYRVKFTK